jgi:acetate kinase
MAGAVLTLNAGSSSLKFALFDADNNGICKLRGIVSALGSAPKLSVRDGQDSLLRDFAWPEGAQVSHEDVLGTVLDTIDTVLAGQKLYAAAHRVVHGGTKYHGPARIDAALLTELAALIPLAPLHQPHNLAPISVLASLRPMLPQIACFDTAFHQTIPEIATHVALPKEFTDAGIRRYGFHGLSYAHIAHILSELAPADGGGRVIAAHLGAGASLCALKNGISIDTTMGFTALDGLMMATRCGAIDPGILLYLQQHHGMSVSDIEDLLYRRAGLQGVSGISGDMRVLHHSADPRAREAIEVFVYHIVHDAGALIAILGGLDGMVFTGGIGEHDVALRARICDAFAWLGASIDHDANRAAASVINTPQSRIKLWVIPADEERTMLRETLTLLPVI